MIKIFDITFLKPYFLLLFIPFFIIFYFYIKNKKYGIFLPTFDDLKKVSKKNNILRYIKFVNIFLIVSVFIIFLTDPNLSNQKQKISKKGIDIVIALDLSNSMLAEDIRPNRLDAAKEVITNFIGKLEADRVGLTLFAGKAFAGSPLTFDYNFLKNTVKNISTETINQNSIFLAGTAIGDALLISDDFFNKKDREKIIILITDGETNKGINPIVVAKSLANKSIKIYTIGIGGDTKTTVSFYMNGNKITKEIPGLTKENLIKIASITNGKFFYADKKTTLNDIFTNISKLEKKEIETEIITELYEYYQPFIYILIFLLFSQMFLESYFYIKD